MGRILALRRRRGAVPEFEAVLARLQEELTLTESFTDLMLRDGNVEVAAAAIDEQRDRLRRTEAAMLAALRPRGSRLRVAVAGLAAVMMLGTGAIAALRVVRPEQRSPAQEVIAQLQEKLQQAQSAPTAAEADQFVTAALDDITNISPEDAGNPDFQAALLQILDERIAAMQDRPMAKRAARRLAAMRDRVRAEVEKLPTPSPSPRRSEEQQPPPTTPPDAPNPTGTG